MAPWHKPMHPGIYVTFFGILLLFLKLVSVPVGIGYFLIFCIILWPLTLVVCAMCVVLFAFMSMIVSDWIKEKI